MVTANRTSLNEIRISRQKGFISFFSVFRSCKAVNIFSCHINMVISFGTHSYFGVDVAVNILRWGRQIRKDLLINSRNLPNSSYSAKNFKSQSKEDLKTSSKVRIKYS